jgi:hypothetical protein
MTGASSPITRAASPSMKPFKRNALVALLALTSIRCAGRGDEVKSPVAEEKRVQISPEPAMKPEKPAQCPTAASDLTYEEAYNLHCGLRLSSGRSVTLSSLRQSRTYLGLVEGLPDTKSSEFFIRNALKKAEEDSHPRSKPVLLPPPRRDYFRTPGDMAEAKRGAFADRNIEWLPLVTCVGEFESSSPARDPEMHASTLTVVWFQAEWAMPIDPAALEAIKKLDWDRLATDFEY